MGRIDGDWYYLDATTGWGGERFMLTEKELSEYSYKNPGYDNPLTYRWNKEKCPATPGSTEESGNENLEETQVQVGELVLGLEDEMSKILKQLGEAKDYEENKSCLYEGMDKTWIYDNITINTYPQGDKDYIDSINIMGEGVGIKSGIEVGDKLSDLEEAYGDRISRESNSIYRLSGKDYGMDFFVNSDSITEIDIYRQTE